MKLKLETIMEEIKENTLDSRTHRNFYFVPLLGALKALPEYIFESIRLRSQNQQRLHFLNTNAIIILR